MHNSFRDEKVGESAQGEHQNEELIDMRRHFFKEEDDYTVASRNYVEDLKGYMNRVNTFRSWLKKPAQLCSLLLARNGFICESENTIRCEMCKCKFVYEKDTYSMYTKINDLCLLHLKNCPWKGKLMGLHIFHLDEESLKRDNLLRDYENMIMLIQNDNYEIPYINIKKTINDFILIIKKHLTNNDAKNKFHIFTSYVEFFKMYYVDIFRNHKDVVDKGIKLIKSNYQNYEKPTVDEAFLNNLSYDPLDVHTYINILSDENSISSLNNPNDDINMYFKIVSKLKNHEYQDVSLYKLIALFGWTYKLHETEKNLSSNILYCRHCFREVDMSYYSTFSRTDNKLNLFKPIDPLLCEEIASYFENHSKGEELGGGKQSLNYIGDIGDVIDHLLSLTYGCVDQKYADGEGKRDEVVGEEGQYDEVKGEEGPCKEVRGEEGPCKEVRGEEGQCKEVRGEEGPCKEVRGEEGPCKEVRGEEGPCKEVRGEEGPCKEVRGEEGQCGEARDEDTMNDALKNDAPKEQEGFPFKWSLKHLFLPKKSTDDVGEKHYGDDTLPSENPLTSSYEGIMNMNEKMDLSVVKEKKKKKKISIKNTLSEVFLEISDYTEDENLFIKTVQDYYVLKGNPNEVVRPFSEDSTKSKNISDTVNGKEELNRSNLYIIRPFNLIENHRVFCPYMTEDLYGFSKITKLFFELLMSESQRRYVIM
ncbi:zinc finger protein [Plasmodium gonderi]|uniref:Zinc finger protein n=1 Tax=Plasmodium gonderi TaxID=77519 RepID=A0A1Y1JFQ2_PLAGO|nr:zinc finger protein [Plasmodium gonderi]GAW81361.1 zinc finger protein [Plasmodium gonderi]